MASSRHGGVVLSAFWLTLFGLAAAAPLLRGEDEDLSDVYRLNLALHHPIRSDLTGSLELDYQRNPDQQSSAYSILWPGVTYRASKWAQLTAGLRTAYVVNAGKDDTLELRAAEPSSTPRTGFG
jgi:hypothetical protein